MTDQVQVAAIDLSKYIEARFFQDRPHVRGRRVPVAVIAYNYHGNQWSIAETARAFTLSESEVLAALLYYAEHRALIDAQEAAEQAEKDKMWQLHGEH